MTDFSFPKGYDVKKEKKSPLILALSCLFLAGCTNSSATALTLTNATTYLAFSGSDSTNGSSSTSTNDGKVTYTVIFDLYPTKYDFETNVKGTCNFTFTPTDGHYVDCQTTKYDSIDLTNIAFAYHAGGTSSDGMAQLCPWGFHFHEYCFAEFEF
jgi:hypothetical protein